MKISKTLLIVSTLFFFSCNSDLDYKQQIKNYNFFVNKADSLLKAKQHEESIRYSNAAIEITDTLSKAIVLNGLAYFNLGRISIAEENFTKVIEIEGETSMAYKYRAKVFLKKRDNDFENDIKIFEKNHPNDNEVSLLKRQYFEEKKDFKGAIEEYTAALKKDPDNISLLTKRADLYIKNGDYQLSVQDCDKILKLNPKNEKIKIKKDDVLLLINNNSNRNNLIVILFSFYLIYVIVSFLILKPLANKKATSQIGGEFEISKDPIIWILPIILSTTFFILLFTNSIPNF